MTELPPLRQGLLLSENVVKCGARPEQSVSMWEARGGPGGSGSLTQPVAGVPFEEGSQETLSLHAEELRHAQLGSEKHSRIFG